MAANRKQAQHKKATSASTAKTSSAKKSGAKASAAKTPTATSPAKAKKHVGDVLGLSRARVPASVPRATRDRGGNPKGIELSRPKRATKRVKVVGGVRVRGS
jgi:hypothetical protein